MQKKSISTKETKTKINAQKTIHELVLLQSGKWVMKIDTLSSLHQCTQIALQILTDFFRCYVTKEVITNKMQVYINKLLSSSHRPNVLCSNYFPKREKKRLFLMLKVKTYLSIWCWEVLTSKLNWIRNWKKKKKI